MSPPCASFHASQLPLQIQSDASGRKRKTDDGKTIDLSACELLGLVQYSCSVDHPERRDSLVKCWPVQRWFRRCQDKKGPFTVETTAWEGLQNAPATTRETSDTSGSYGTGLTSHWHDANKLS